MGFLWLSCARASLVHMFTNSHLSASSSTSSAGAQATSGAMPVLRPEWAVMGGLVGVGLGAGVL